MTASANLASFRTSIKVQSVVGTPETGAGATQIQTLAGQGFQNSIKTALTELLDQTRQSGRPRQGSKFYNFPIAVEATVGAGELLLEGALGGTFAAAIVATDADLTSCVISGTGTTITFGGGSLITLGGRAGMMATFTALATAGNDAVPFPILSISANGRVLTIPSGYLADETIDSAFTITLARSLISATPYTDRVHTLEVYLGTDVDRSLQGSGFRFNSFGLDITPNKKTKESYGLGGTKLQLLATGSSPFFSSPTLVEGESLYMVDGGLYINGVKRLNLSGLTLKNDAPIAGIDLVGTNDSPDAFLSQFKGTGQITSTLTDGSDWDLFDAETVFSIIAHCKEQTTQNFRTYSVMNASFGNWSIPSAGEGPAIQTIPINFGKDKRGATLGYAPSSFVVSST